MSHKGKMSRGARFLNRENNPVSIQKDVEYFLANTKEETKEEVKVEEVKEVKKEEKKSQK